MAVQMHLAGRVFETPGLHNSLAYQRETEKKIIWN
jgi:hypothetical protein